MTDAGGIYIPWYIWMACGMVWLFAIIGGCVAARTIWHYVNRSPKS
jgi:hypothetical protein